MLSSLQEGPNVAYASANAHTIYKLHWFKDPEEEERRLRKIDQYISRVLTDRNSKRTMAEFTSIPPAFWRDHPDPEARAFYLGPGLNLRSKQFARAHGIPIVELPPGGPPLAEMETLPAPPTALTKSRHYD